MDAYHDNEARTFFGMFSEVLRTQSENALSMLSAFPRLRRQANCDTHRITNALEKEKNIKEADTNPSTKLRHTNGGDRAHEGEEREQQGRIHPIKDHDTDEPFVTDVSTVHGHNLRGKLTGQQ